MNKKGFTVIELVTSFSIAMVIIVVLFNVVLIMKENYKLMDQRTDLLIKKDNLSYALNQKFKNSKLVSLEQCNDYDKCYLFTYEDNHTDKLVYKNNDMIKFNAYTFEISNSMSVSEPIINEYYDDTTSTLYDGYFIITIPITFNEKDYSIKVIHQFNTENLKIVI